MIVDLGTPLVPEVAMALLAVLVLIVGLIRPGRAIGWITFAGLLGVFAIMSVARQGSLINGSFVQDELALFAKRLFLVASAVCLLGSLTLRQPAFNRRAAEYYFALLVSLLGMLVLASARV
jgi:NADH:ubiquinone oxidoreductase subunit 2 (subunit N)